ncbi:MAG: hypothetical protein JST42_21960 [Bacteroidetes bacterium]|nr:hypothetical protein [Bacteroidota bacterium]
MKKFVRQLLLVFLTIAACRPEASIAQTASDSAKPYRSRSYLEIAVNYQSDNVYLGRKDTVRLPYVIPTFTYNHRSGIYLSASAAWLNAADANRIDLVTLDLGYSVKKGHYTGDYWFSKYFYNKDASSVTSGIPASLNMSDGYDLGFLKPTLDLTLDIATHLDFQTGFGLEHKFTAFDDDLEITPRIAANASTLNFYDSYYRNRRFRKQKGKTIITGTEQITAVVTNASAFRIMDYEASLPLSYSLGSLIFSCTPSYVIPVHPSVISVTRTYSVTTIPGTTKLQTEQLSNTFFFTAGLSWQF